MGFGEVLSIMQKTTSQVLSKVEETIASAEGRSGGGGIELPKDFLVGRRFLVVDDSLMMRKFFQALLGTQNAECLVADNGITALASMREERASSRKLDVVVVDLKMPGMGGKELIREIRADARLKDLPIVIHSTSNDRQTIVDCASSGINAYIIKPSVPAKILQTLGEVIYEVEHEPTPEQNDCELCGLSASDLRILMDLINDAAISPDDPVAKAAIEFIKERQLNRTP